MAPGGEGREREQGGEKREEEEQTGVRSVKRAKGRSLAQLRRGLDRQAGLRRHDPHDPPRDQSRTTPGGWCSTTAARRWSSTRRPCRLRRPRWTASTACRSRAARTPATAASGFPAYEVVKDSIQIVRGCFGGCAFCSLTAHQGRVIQSRSRQVGARRDPPHGGRSGILGRDQRHRRADGQHVRHELRLARDAPQVPPPKLPPSDALQAAGDRSRAAGGAAAGRAQRARACNRSSWPRACEWTSPGGVRRISRSWPGTIRADCLKVAPEHTDPEVLRLMKKPAIEEFDAFEREFRQAAAAAGKEQYLVPYFMAGHPGCDLARHDPPGPVPQADRLPARQGAGLHPAAHGPGHVHVLHGDRPADGRAGPRAAGASTSGGCSGRCCSSGSRRTTPTSARPWSRPAGRT